MSTTSRRRRVALLYTYLNLLKYEEKRWWVRPIYQNRQQQGDYYNLLQEMRLNDTESYFNYMRMTPTQFDELLNIVGPLLEKETVISVPIEPGQRLALTIRHLAAGDSISTLSYSYRIGKTTVSKIIIETTEAIWTSLKDVVFMIAIEENWKHIVDNFHKKWNFPNCIGAIDGKHVAMQAPNNTGSEFYNYKDFHSIVLLGICDANYRFSVVDIGASGRQSDGGILRNSTFFKRLDNGTLNIPSGGLLPHTSIKTPYVLVGDEAFPLKPFLMRPYPGRNTSSLPSDVRVYNYRLSRARRIIENTFGILVSRWRIFRRAIIGKVTTVESIVKATTCLHNWLQQKNNELRMEDRQYCPPNYTDSENLHNGEMIPGAWRNDANNSLSSMGRASTNMYSNNTAQIRETFKKYFFHEGSVPWQWNICNVNMNDHEINNGN